MLILGCSNTVKSVTPTKDVKVNTPIGEELTPTANIAIENVTPASTKLPDATPTSVPFPIGYEEMIFAGESWKVFDEMISTNLGCELPCWLGILPGETSWDNTRGFFAKLNAYFRLDADYPNGIDRLGVYGLNSPDSSNKSIAFFEQGNEIRGLLLSSIDQLDTGTFSSIWQLYTPSNALQRKSPTRISIEFFRPDPPNALYELIFFYDEDNYMIVYSGNADFVENGFSVCPANFIDGNLFTSIYFLAISPDEPLSLDEFFEFAAFNIDLDFQMRDLEEVSDYSIQEFAELLTSGEENPCIVVDP
jgi:hypothetical protein